jgi:hypothetical protein
VDLPIHPPGRSQRHPLLHLLQVHLRLSHLLLRVLQRRLGSCLGLLRSVSRLLSASPGL